MDALTCLRLAIMEGRAATVKLDGSELAIDDQRFPAMAETAFRAGSATGAAPSRHYKLLALWMQYVMRDKGFAEYMNACTEVKLPVAELVMITDKKDVVDYLTGVSAAHGRIDSGKVTLSSAAPMSQAAA